MQQWNCADNCVPKWSSQPSHRGGNGKYEQREAAWIGTKLSLRISGCPGGTFENSPAIHCRVFCRTSRVPEGRLKRGGKVCASSAASWRRFGRPSGTRQMGTGNPAINCRATFRPSLRDGREPRQQEVSRAYGMAVSITWERGSSFLSPSATRATSSPVHRNKHRRTACDGYPRNISSEAFPLCILCALLRLIRSPLDKHGISR